MSINYFESGVTKVINKWGILGVGDGTFDTLWNDVGT